MILNRKEAPSMGKVEKLSLSYPEIGTMESGNPSYTIRDSKTHLIKIDLMWNIGFSGKQKYLHFLLSKSVFSGTNDMDASSIETQMKMLGCEYNFVVFEEHATLKFKGLKKNYLKAVSLLLSFFDKAIFPEEELTVLKKMEAASLESRFKTPGYWASRELTEKLYPTSHPKFRISETSDIHDVTREQLLKYHTSFKIKDSTLFIYGDVSTSDEKELSSIIGSFGQYEPTVKKVLNYQTSQMEKGFFSKPVKNTNQVVLNAAYIQNDIKESEMPLVQLMNISMGGFFGSRLMKEVRENKGLTYGIGSSVSWQNGLFKLQVSCQMNAQNAGLAIEAIKEIINSIQKDGITEEEFHRSKRYFIGQLYSSVDAPDSLLNKIQHALSKNKPINTFEQKCNTILNAKIDTINLLAQRICTADKFAWCSAGDVS